MPDLLRPIKRGLFVPPLLLPSQALRRPGGGAAVPSWVTALDPDAIAAWDGAGDRSYVQGVEGSLLDGLVSYTGGPGSAVDLSGTWSQFGSNVLRRTNKGLLVEAAETNHIRNNSMQGASVGVIGSGGVLPNNVTINGGTNLAREVVALGTLNGRDYGEFRLFGTAGSTGFDIALETTTAVVAVQGETWVLGMELALANGSFNNIGFSTFDLIQRTSGGSFIAGQSTSGLNLKTLTSAMEFRSYSAPLNLESLGRVQPRIGASGNSNGQYIDVTYRISWPRLAKASSLLYSPIRTTNAAVTRAADAVELKDPGVGFDLHVIFDDDSTQTIGGQSGNYTLPTNLNRPTIKAAYALAA